MKFPLMSLLFGAALALPAGCALAQGQTYQQPVYKCADGKGGVTYSHVPCGNAKVLGEKPPKPAASRTVPQDRARLAARAQLTPEQLEQCVALETQMSDQQALLKAKADKGEKVTDADEGVLVRLRLKLREQRC